MRVMFPLVAVAVLILLGYMGGQAPGLHFIFAVVVPYLAAATFIVGFIAKVVGWAKSPVPFRIPTTCGQEKSLPWVKWNRLEAPHTTMDVIARMALEVFAFRSLFRGTKAKVDDSPRFSYSTSLTLWLAGLAFHWSFLIIFIRHFRLFTEPVPALITMIEGLDGFFQIMLPAMYMTDLVIVGAATFLIIRRLTIPEVKYISLAADYFPLFLILSIVVTGMLMRYVMKTDIAHVKQMINGIMSFNPIIVEGISPLFYVHLFLVSSLLAYFPLSKLMHMGGVFMSPTRNLANTSRIERHINPWNPEVHIHTYEEYEADFWKVMKSVDLPLDKNYEEEKK